MSIRTSYARRAGHAGSFDWKNSALYSKMKQLLAHNDHGDLIRYQGRIVGAGDFGAETNCSLINPGALYDNDEFKLLLRGESDESIWLGQWGSQAAPIWCVLDADLTVKEHFLRQCRSTQPKQRPEDWRLFEYQGKILSNHSVYIENCSGYECRLGISEIDLARRELNLKTTLRPPFEPTQEEKNWAFFVRDGALLCIYSFLPWIVLEIDLSSGRASVVTEATDLQFDWIDKGNQFIGNSTNPVEWDDDHFVTFIHDYFDPDWPEQRNRLYMQYAVLIDKKSLLPTSIVPNPLVMGGQEEGRHSGVHYTMSLVGRDEQLYAFYGEGDSHSGVVVFNKRALAQLFETHHL